MRPASGAACRDRPKSVTALQDSNISGLPSGTAGGLTLGLAVASGVVQGAVSPSGFAAATVERSQRAVTIGRPYSSDRVPFVS